MPKLIRTIAASPPIPPTSSIRSILKANSKAVCGLGHAINSEIIYSDGMAQQAKYWDAKGRRMSQTPRSHLGLRETQLQIRGIGEPPVPPAPPTLANAIFAARGQRLRDMPFWHHIDFA
ncbi:MAG: hypothetical protein AAGA70_13195 [Pseudomonadota bacterium]